MNKQKLSKRMIALVEQIGVLQSQAVAMYSPIVDQILRTQDSDVHRIEQTLDGLLDFCGNDDALVLYRKLCRHYFSIDPVAAVGYVSAYREMYDESIEDLEKQRD